MRTFLKVVIAACVVLACLLAWGYWHAATHASLQLQVDDYGLKTDQQLYGTPHDVTLTYYGAANEPLASARSIEPLGYILAIHPDPKIGDCSQYKTQAPYSECFAVHSAWDARWAPRARTANIKVGACKLHGVPVSVYRSPGDWWLWWVPLPHIGGTPLRYFQITARVDSKTCSVVSQ
jgi:hypothetical protein